MEAVRVVARDRSLVTITALRPARWRRWRATWAGRSTTVSRPRGVRSPGAPAIYCGWPSVVASLDAYDQVYTARKVDTAALSAVGPRLQFRPRTPHEPQRTEALVVVAPKFVQLTNDVVFDDLWRRSDLTLRDRSLVTIVALAAMGDDDQLEFYLRRGVESGLTRAQLTEAVTHLAFYAGWGRATKAMTVVAKTRGE